MLYMVIFGTDIQFVSDYIYGYFKVPLSGRATTLWKWSNDLCGFTYIKNFTCIFSKNN